MVSFVFGELFGQLLYLFFLELQIGDEHLVHGPVAEKLRKKQVKLFDSMRVDYLLLSLAVDQSDLG